MGPRLEVDRESGTHSKPSLLVAPASLLANWAAEIERFAPSLKALIAHPSATRAAAAGDFKIWRPDLLEGVDRLTALIARLRVKMEFAFSFLVRLFHPRQHAGLPRRSAKPETILAWYRRLIAQKFDGSKFRKAPGRPPLSRDVVELVVRAPALTQR